MSDQLAERLYNDLEDTVYGYLEMGLTVEQIKDQLSLIGTVLDDEAEG